jgi:hypothetical protein
MSADILSDPDFPHGSTEGYSRGCKGANCPALIACRDVHFRYAGDYDFRRAVDGGMTPAEVVEREQAAAPSALRPVPAPRGTRKRRTLGPDGLPVPASPYQAKVKELVTVRRYTDAQVAEALGKTRDQASAARKSLGLPVNPVRPSTLASAGVSSS